MSFAKNYPPFISMQAPSSANPDDLQMWANQLIQSLIEWHREMAEGFQNIVLEGTTAQKPLASGTGRFYYDTTLNRLEYDNGTWNVI